MSRYLEEAAELLRKAAATHEQYYADLSHIRGIEKDLMEGRERIAREFATLAAIDKGLLPAEITQDVIAALISRTTA
jgi:hypothetical protein